jgi:hypothetical protein
LTDTAPPLREERAALISIRCGAILLMVSAGLAARIALVEPLFGHGAILSVALGAGLGVTLWATQSRVVAVLILALMLCVIWSLSPFGPMFFRKRHELPTFPRLTIDRDTAREHGSRGGDDEGWRQA